MCTQATVTTCDYHAQTRILTSFLFDNGVDHSTTCASSVVTLSRATKFIPFKTYTCIEVMYTVIRAYLKL